MAGAADPALAAQWGAHGIAPFDADVGLAALGTLMESGATEAVAARVDWARLTRWCREEGSGASLYGRVAAEPEAQSGTAAPPVTAPGPAELEAIVREAVATVLDRSLVETMLGRPLGNLGFASCAAVWRRNGGQERGGWGRGV